MVKRAANGFVLSLDSSNILAIPAKGINNIIPETPHIRPPMITDKNITKAFRSILLPMMIGLNTLLFRVLEIIIPARARSGTVNPSLEIEANIKTMTIPTGVPI